MRKLVLVLCFCFLFAACENVKDLKFDKDNQNQVMEKVRTSKGLTQEEIGLLMAAFRSAVSSRQSMEGKTVAQVIKEQKAIKEQADVRATEAKRLNEGAQRKESEMAVRFPEIVVAPYKKAFHKADVSRGDYDDRIDITFVIENKGARDIRAFKGRTIFTDLFGSEIYSTDVEYDREIKAGATREWMESIKYNQLVPEQQELNHRDLTNMRFQWKPRVIIFTDGSRVGAEE